MLRVSFITLATFSTERASGMRGCSGGVTATARPSPTLLKTYHTTAKVVKSCMTLQFLCCFLCPSQKDGRTAHSGSICRFIYEMIFM